METNRIIEELRAKASLDWNPEQKAWFEQQANDARPVECVRMLDVFTPEQLRFLRDKLGYKTQKKCVTGTRPNWCDWLPVLVRLH